VGVRRHAIFITLLGSHLVVAAFALFFHLRLRVEVLTAFEEFGTAMPAPTRLALTPWFLPGALGVAGLLALPALALPIKRSQRAWLLGAGLVISSSALVLAVWAALAPIFSPA